MSSILEEEGTRSCWFVGAMYGGSDDQTPRFIAEGIWENGYEDKYLDLVKAIQPGDRIAIKSSYTRKHDLPFDNREQTVSVMAIKAIGTVTDNFNDGRKIRVDWRQLDSPREWYFFTHRGTVWRVGQQKSCGSQNGLISLGHSQVVRANNGYLNTNHHMAQVQIGEPLWQR